MKILRTLLMLAVLVFAAGARAGEAPREAAPPHDRGGWPLALAGVAIAAWVARRRLASPY